MTIKEQMPIAIQAMKDLGIHRSFITKFQYDGVVTQFIRYAGYYIDEQTECDLLHQIRTFEATHGALVYAVTQEKFPFGRCFTFLYVSKYKQDNLHILQPLKDEDADFLAQAYVYNADDDWCSEFGTVGIKTSCGGLRRVW